jgi:microcystin-dependent protein
MPETTTHFNWPLADDAQPADIPTYVNAGLRAADQTVHEYGFAPGDIKFSHAVELQDGWLWCEGQDVQRSEYPALCEALDPEGEPTVKLPDYRARMPLGTDGDAYELGDDGGEETHVLTVNEMPAHNHTFAAGSNGFFGSIGFPRGFNYPPFAPYTGGPAWNAEPMDLRGGGAAHNNLPPYNVCHVLIKT